MDMDVQTLPTPTEMQKDQDDKKGVLERLIRLFDYSARVCYLHFRQMGIARV